MSGRALQAGCLALERFTAEIKAHPAKTDFQKFGTFMENYEVVFRESDRSFFVTFRIKPYRGRVVLDGISTYEVNKDDLTVVRTRSL